MLGTRATPARVHDQVGAEQQLGAAVGRTHLYPGDATAARGGDQSYDDAAVQKPQVGKGPNTGPHVTFQQGPAGGQEHQAGSRLPKLIAAEVVARVGQQVTDGCSIGNQSLVRPGNSPSSACWPRAARA